MIDLGDLRHALVERPVPPGGAQRALAAAKRRRRGRYAVVATVLAVIAALVPLETLVLTHRSSAPAGPSQPDRPTVYTGVGTIVKSATGPAQLCLGVQFTTGSFPLKSGTATEAYCSGRVTLRGVVLDQLPVGTTKNGAVYTQPLRVTGTYQGGVFTLTRQPQVTKDRPTELWSRSLPLPCAAPAGGWSDKRMTDAEQELVTDYEGTRPDTWGGGWLLNDQRIFVTAFTRDLDAARQALQSLSDHVCVTKAARTYLEMRAVADSFRPTPAEMNRLHVNGASVDEVNSELVIGVVLADEPITSYVTAHFAPGLVRLQPFLTPVGG
jgi:hypothetical protein